MTVMAPKPAEPPPSTPDVYRSLADLLATLDNALTVPVGCYPPPTDWVHG